MWILVAEAMGALGLLLLIVWWTLGPTQRRERDALRDALQERSRHAGDVSDRRDRDAKRSPSDDPG